MATVCLNALHQEGFMVEAVIPPPNSNPTCESFSQFARGLNLEVLNYEKNPNTPEMIEKIAAKKADIGIICSFDTLLKKEFLNTTRLGFINCHPSLLPKYRGANPYFHIINNGEKTTGITLHFADEHFDTGSIIAQKGFMLEEKETIGTLFNRSNFMCAQMLTKVLNDLENTGKIDSKPQLEGDYIKAPKIQNQIRIGTSCSCREIDRIIRASNPFYSTFLFFRGAPVKIFSIDFKEKNHPLECGTITKVNKNTIEIAVSDGFIYPKVLQSGSWGIFDTEHFIAIFKPQTGETFN